MDSSWQTKCDSTFQLSTPPMVSSASQDPRGQLTEINSSYCMYPRVSHGLRSKFVGGMQDLHCPRFSYVTNHAACHANAGNSFLALLSGPPSLLQCEFHELSDSKPCTSSANFPAAGGNFVVDSVGSETFLTTTKGLLREKFSNQKMQIKADAFPAITSRAMVGQSSGVKYIFSDIHIADTSVQPSVPCSEKAREPFSSKLQCCGTTPASNLNIYSSDIQAMPNVALEGTSSKTSTPLMSGCPRVFCMGKSGYLLLSNTGLLGVVCSCHCHHMSVLKFCEHSGLHNINPGDAVHMESGETIAQWQKLYFLKFGIRSPGNESEWDWPEVLSKSATASLMKSNGTNSNMSQSDLSHLFNPPAVSLQPGKPSDNVVFPKDAHTDHHLFVGTLSEKQQTTIHDGCNIPVKGFSGNIRNNLPDRVNRQLMESNLATYFTPPNFLGTERNDGCEVTTAYLDSLKRNGNLSIAYSPLQNPISLRKDLDFSNNKKANEGFNGRDGSSSNIELKLNQPPQTGNPLLSIVEPQQFDGLFSPPKLQYLKQMTHNSAESLSREEELPNNFFYAAGPSNTKMVEGQSQLKLRNSGVSNGLGAVRARSETDTMAKGFGFSPYSNFNFHSQGNMKANEILVNDGGVISSKILQYGSNTLQSCPTNVLWNSNDHIERQLNNSSLGSNKFLDNDKGAGCAEENAKTDSGSKISKLTESPSVMRAVGGSSDCCFSALNGKVSCHDREPSMMVSTSTGTSISCHSRKNSFVGQDNHVTSRSWGSQMASGMLSEGILMGCPFLVSSSTSDQTPTLLEQEGSKDTCLFDENMRLLALTQLLELSKHQHALCLHEINRKQGRSSNFSNIQHCIFEASTSKQGTSEVTLKSSPKKEACGNPGIIDDIEKLASLTGLNRYCSLSTVAPIPVHLKEKELQCKHSCDLRNEDPSLSLGRSEGITRSCECETCSEQPSDTHLVDKYTSATQINCLGNKFILGVAPSPQSLRRQPVNTCGESSLMIASNFTEDQSASKDVTNQFVQGAKFDVQDLNKFGSHNPQWRDRPSKIRKAVRDVGSLDQPAVASDCEGQGGDQLGNVPVKRLKRTFYVEDSLKEQESSNVSSGCSAPVVTQSSVEVNNADSSTVDAVDNQCFDNLVVDEGSGIEKSWSSEALDSDRSCEFLSSSTCETSLKKAYLRVLNDRPRHSLLDELKLLDSLTWKKGRDQNHARPSVNCKTSQSPKVKRAFKDKKRKRMEIRMLDAMFPSRIPSLLHENDESTAFYDFPSNLSKEMKMYFASSQQRSTSRTSFVQCGTKKRAAFSSKFLSGKNHLRRNHSDIDEQNSNESESDCDAEFNKFTEVSERKKLRKDLTSESFRQFEKQEPACEEAENALLKLSYSRQVNAFRKTRPVVCGKYGEISNGMFAGDVPKPAKIVSLSKVLKASKKCKVPKNGKSRLTSKKKWKKLSSGTSKGYCFRNIGLKTKENNGTWNALVCDETNVDISKEDLKTSNKPLVICKVKSDIKPDQVGSIVERIHAPLKLKSKEIRKRSIYELTAKETRVKKILEYAEDREHYLCNTNSNKSVQEHSSASNVDSDAFCCVCRSSSNDEINRLLECSQCLIRVHQACYGISTIPKGSWSCRPCRTNSKDIACVLCGYGGGAMTRALRSHTIVKGLLKVWNFEKEGMCKHTTLHEMFEKEMGVIYSTKSAPEGDQNCVSRPESIEPSTTDLRKVETSTSQMQRTPYSNGNFGVRNSITAGVLDSTVKQWVHMVCGLWTPRTRCPNVDTMSAFDVSGVSCPKADTVCSICNRWGGSCIECRVVDCSVQFHPWCAHQKNLLQSEAEGVDDEKVGFYGRCVLHADNPICQAKLDLIGNEMVCPERMQSTCARTEGYKRCRRDGFQHDHYGVLKGKGGCLVPQEQLNAWIHINGQKSCSQGLPKFPALDIEYDCRKEYARYKQAKSWKHLVVYKSGIHALGLYTSWFISRGEMVVEYVGEIVGLRVADKREIEYQSGRKLQYKSACYFFRVDKEHIIDATRKGGIARFVNHSCLPNCVAKVITIRHEKKVVFFAERDIFPGEEITYDYHFNHEDEGQKIPCYCNSKNCRRYLN